MTAYIVRKKEYEAKIFFTNQRSPAEQGPGPIEGLSSSPQLCWWSLIWQSSRLITGIVEVRCLPGPPCPCSSAEPEHRITNPGWRKFESSQGYQDKVGRYSYKRRNFTPYQPTVMEFIKKYLDSIGVYDLLVKEGIY